MRRNAICRNPCDAALTGVCPTLTDYLTSNRKGVNGMAHRCGICGKGPQFGHNVSFSQRHTKRRWTPNLQQATIRRGERRVKLHVCTRCLRTLNKS